MRFAIFAMLTLGVTAAFSLPNESQLERLELLRNFDFTYPDVYGGERAAVYFGLRKHSDLRFTGTNLLDWLQGLQDNYGRINVDCFLYVQLMALVMDGKSEGPFTLEYGRRGHPWRHPDMYYLSVDKLRFPDVYGALQLSDSPNKGMWVLQTSDFFFRFLGLSGVQEMTLEDLINQQISALQFESWQEQALPDSEYDKAGIKPISKVLANPRVQEIVYDPSSWRLE